MTRFIILLAVSSLFFIQATKAQRKGNGLQPLHYFLQSNADTTVIFEAEKKAGPIRYLMISKKNDTLTCYTYQDLIYEMGYQIPGNIRKSIIKNKKMNLWNYPVDVNDFFNPYPIPDDAVRRFWKQLMALNLWSIKDDALDGEGCASHAVVDDASRLKLYLITKKEIKTLKFYGAEDFEQLCPGRAGRISMLKIKGLFEAYMR